MNFIIEKNTIWLLREKSNGDSKDHLPRTKVFVDTMKKNISVIGYLDRSYVSDLWQAPEILVGTRGQECGYLIRARLNNVDGTYVTKTIKQAPATNVCDVLPACLDNQISHTASSQGVLITACSPANNGVWLAELKDSNWQEVIGQTAIKEYTDNSHKVDLRFKLDVPVEKNKEPAVKLIINYQSLRPSQALSLETAISNNSFEIETKTIEIDITSNLINLGFKLKETVTLNENYKKQFK